MKAVRFKGKYYKCDFEQDPNIVSWMFNSLSESKNSLAQESSSKKNPVFMANRFMDEEIRLMNPEDNQSPKSQVNHFSLYGTMPNGDPEVSEY